MIIIAPTLLLVVKSCNLTLFSTFLVPQMVKNLPAMRETWVQSLGWEDPLRRAWQPTPVFLPEESPWTEEPGGLYSRVLYVPIFIIIIRESITTTSPEHKRTTHLNDKGNPLASAFLMALVKRVLPSVLSQNIGGSSYYDNFMSFSIFHHLP